MTLFNEHLLKTPTVGFYLDRDWRNDNSKWRRRISNRSMKPRLAMLKKQAKSRLVT